MLLIGPNSLNSASDGACGRVGTVNFRWATILLPVGRVDYVIVHELAQLVEPHHTQAFWLQVGRAMSEYDQRGNWLTEHGGRNVLL